MDLQFYKHTIKTSEDKTKVFTAGVRMQDSLFFIKEAKRHLTYFQSINLPEMINKKYITYTQEETMFIRDFNQNGQSKIDKINNANSAEKKLADSPFNL